MPPARILQNHSFSLNAPPPPKEGYGGRGSKRRWGVLPTHPSLPKQDCDQTGGHRPPISL